VSTDLDPENLRRRIAALHERGVKIRDIAIKADLHGASLSDFRGGGKWGLDRLTRLRGALDALEASLPPRASPVPPPPAPAIVASYLDYLAKAAPAPAPAPAPPAALDVPDLALPAERTPGGG